VHSLAKRVLGQIERQELIRPGDRVGVAVSGGIDSVALLRLLLELRHKLGIVLSIVHFNHKLRGAEADADQAFVETLAREHGLEFLVDSGDAAGLAAQERSGLEAAARELRYGFFERLLGGRSAEAGVLSSQSSGSPPLHKIVTAHTLDDQAETVLMRVIRGTGLRGLGGIHPRILVEHENDEGRGEIVRPLLEIRRRELEGYLADLKQAWREDATNAESAFTRNRVRKKLLPVVEREFNPAIVENLSELAEIARDEEDYWEGELSGWLGTVVHWIEPEWARGNSSDSLVQIQPPGAAPEAEEEPSALNASVSRPWLLTEPRAVQRRAVKAIGEQAGIPLEFKHVEEILRFAAEDGPPRKELSLPLGWKLVRQAEEILFVAPDMHSTEPANYQYSLQVPGRVIVPELGETIEALRIAYDPVNAEYNAQQLLRADLVRELLILRNWRAGDRFWPPHTKEPKKVKELLQERHVHEAERKLWPVVVSGNEIVWMRGFAVPARLAVARAQEAVLIRELERNGPV
jgi:tRNA(Ile)-lysidine synthase